MAVIETENVVKHYGKVHALKGVSLEVRPGEIFGLLGRNGAGKTTLVKILLGIVKPSRGRANLLGAPAGTSSVRQRVGFLAEDHRFPEYHTGYSLLDFYGALLGVTRSERRRRIPAMLDLVGLKDRMHTKIRTYSKGMKQRVGIAQSMMHDPDVLFLDEPTDGVDPVGRREIRETLTQLRSAGKTIFLNSHLLGEVEMITDRVAIMELGKIVKLGTVDELTTQKGLFRIGLGKGSELPVEEVARRGYKVRAISDGLWEISLTEGQSIDPIVKLIVERGLLLRYLVEKKETLEDIFMSVVEAEAVRA
jgi:ABC-2 type transport system ATP-binding protein